MKNLKPLILIFIAIVAFFMFVDPEYKKVKQLNAEIDNNKEILKIAERLKSEKQALNTKFNQISQTEKAELEKLLPDTVDNVRLIIDINAIASQFGIVIRDIDIKSKGIDVNESKKVVAQKSNFDGVLQDGNIKYVDTSKIGVLSFSFTVSSRYEVFIEFLKQLEESLRIVDIRNIEITRGASDVFYDYKVTFDTYWLK